LHSSGVHASRVIKKGESRPGRDCTGHASAKRSDTGAWRVNLIADAARNSAGTLLHSPFASSGEKRSLTPPPPMCFRNVLQRHGRRAAATLTEARQCVSAIPFATQLLFCFVVFYFITLFWSLRPSPRAVLSQMCRGTRALGVGWRNGSGNAEASFSHVWLRDNCLCPECLHPKTLQRQIDTLKARASQLCATTCVVGVPADPSNCW
jgi:hypothetical protein